MKTEAAVLTAEWRLPAAATLGSKLRAKGILLEIRARLPFAARKSLAEAAGALSLTMPEGSDDLFRVASEIVSKALESIESLPVIPREIEDILAISTTERHRWLKDGRLQSAGTRTVKLRGRAKKITFHVFDPRLVEDVLDRDLMEVWRLEDATAAKENRRRAAGKAALARGKKAAPAETAPSLSRGGEGQSPKLRDWEDFERDQLLR